MFSELGCEAETEKRVNTSRGSHNVDVFVVDCVTAPPATYLCECKLCNRPVTQNAVVGFRQIVTDSGADRGYLISKKGFQSGAITAARHSNVVLVTPESLQELFSARWLETRTALWVSLCNDFPDRIEAAMDTVARSHGQYKHWPIEAQRFYRRQHYAVVCSGAIAMHAKWTTKFPITMNDPYGDSDDRKTVTIGTVRECMDFAIGSLRELCAQADKLAAKFSRDI